MLKNIIPLILFFLLTPGILWTYSKKHNKYSIAILHACLFAFVFYFIQSNTPIREGLAKNNKRLGFKLFSGLKKDKEVQRKIKQVHGEKTKIEFTSKKEVILCLLILMIKLKICPLKIQLFLCLNHLCRFLLGCLLAQADQILRSVCSMRCWPPSPSAR